MTNEEAIDILSDNHTVLYSHGDYTEQEESKALSMAIKALEQQPCEDCISREAVNDGFKKYENGSFAYGCVWGYINELPPVTPKQQSCEDCISRQAVLSYICNDLEFGDEENGCDLERKIAQEEIYNFVKRMSSVTLKSEYEHDHEVVKAYNDGQAYILDKIRAEIEQGYCKVENDYDKGRNMGLHIAMQIIDKYSEVSE